MLRMIIRGGKQVTVSPVITDSLFSLSNNLTSDSTSRKISTDTSDHYTDVIMKGLKLPNLIITQFLT